MDFMIKNSKEKKKKVKFNKIINNIVQKAIVVSTVKNKNLRKKEK